MLFKKTKAAHFWIEQCIILLNLLTLGIPLFFFFPGSCISSSRKQNDIAKTIFIHKAFAPGITFKIEDKWYGGTINWNILLEY